MVLDHQEKEEVNRTRVPPLYSYINSGTTGGGASVQANSRVSQKGSVNERAIRKDNE